MQSINLDIGYFNHPKTRRLIGLLGRKSDVLPIRLWCYIAKYHGDSGRLQGYSPKEIESIVLWWGKEGAMVQAMVQVGFLERDGDTLVAHNWLERNGHIPAFKDRAKKAAEVRWKKIRGRGDPPLDSGVLGDASSNATSIAKPMLKQCPNVPTNKLTNQQHQQPTVLTERVRPDVVAAAADYKFFETILQQQWGVHGKIGAAVLAQFAELGKKHGREKMEYAVREAAMHNACNLAYVRAILEPKQKSAATAAAAPKKIKITQCQYCGERMEESHLLHHQQFDVCKEMKRPSPETMRKAIEDIEKLAERWKQ